MQGTFFDMMDDDCDDEGFFIEKPDTVSSSPMMGIKKGSRVERGEKGFPVCSNCKTELNYRCEDGIWKYEPYCAHCGARLIEEGKR